MTDEAARGDATVAPDAGSAGPGLGASVPRLGVAACYFATVLGGLALADEAAALGLVLFDDPGQVGNVGVFAAMVLGFTVVLVAAVRYDRGLDLVRLLLVGSFGILVADAVVLGTGLGRLVTDDPALVGLPASPLPVAVAVLTAAALWRHPEWYVLNVAAVVGGAAGVAMLGLSFGPLPIVVLLVVWAAYDAYAVYGSGHMKEVAAGAGSMKAPLVFVVPESRDFSYRETDLGGLGVDDEDGGDGGDAGGDGFPATILGLGDALIPGMLAVSAAHFLDAPVVVPALGANLPALGAVAGGVVGLAALTYILERFEGVHAGLPPLNASVLAGYVLGAVAAGIPVTTALGL
ncbi:presenilin family intramembrane aspartyl protease PSH [Salinilacihabitans rarus]|uniref:presenilin family intramembrane aspartyl protease PSH n=1 Tax=Salinilacihabitans rarus TaxID=2961596 RepID=UPI0020C8DFDF|nr:presenilin family intramembrane aspartyl protease PSH [Salinilacihabitans rarus]